MTEPAIDPIDLRTFPPVPPLSKLPEAWRQTLVSKYVECPRSAYLYLKYNGGAMTHPLGGGTLLHRTVERYIGHLLAENERIGNPEMTKDMLNEVLAESTDLTVSPDRFDSLRAMMYHLAEGFAIEPERVVCLETPVAVELEGHRVTGTIDFAEATPFGLTIIDWKSAFYNVARETEDPEGDEFVPSKEEWTGTFQLVLYAFALATGSIEGTPEGFNFRDVPEFRLKQIHPRHFWENEGTMAYREAVIDRDTLLDWRLYLVAVVEQMAKSFETWKFPAVQGTHCDFCPASAECPIPAPLRAYRGEIRTDVDAKRAAIEWVRHGQVRDDLGKALRGYLKATGARVRHGRDQETRLKTVEQTKFKRKVEVPGGKKRPGREALIEGVHRALDNGLREFEPDWYFDKSVSSRMTTRKLTPAELTAEKAGTNPPSEEKPT